MIVVRTLANYANMIFQSLKFEFQNVFNNPERRFALLTTIGVSLIIVLFLLTDIRRLNRIFYKPELSIFENMLNFAGIMCCCFLFGAFFSRLTLWVRSGTFKIKNEEEKRKQTSDKNKKQ